MARKKRTFFGRILAVLFGTSSTQAAPPSASDMPEPPTAPPPPVKEQPDQAPAPVVEEAPKKAPAKAKKPKPPPPPPPPPAPSPRLFALWSDARDVDDEIIVATGAVADDAAAVRKAAVASSPEELLRDNFGLLRNAFELLLSREDASGEAKFAEVLRRRAQVATKGYATQKALSEGRTRDVAKAIGVLADPGLPVGARAAIFALTRTEGKEATALDADMLSDVITRLELPEDAAPALLLLLRAAIAPSLQPSPPPSPPPSARPLQPDAAPTAAPASAPAPTAPTSGPANLSDVELAAAVSSSAIALGLAAAAAPDSPSPRQSVAREWTSELLAIATGASTSNSAYAPTSNRPWSPTPRTVVASEFTSNILTAISETTNAIGSALTSIFAAATCGPDGASGDIAGARVGFQPIDDAPLAATDANLGSPTGEGGGAPSPTKVASLPLPDAQLPRAYLP